MKELEVTITMQLSSMYPYQVFHLQFNSVLIRVINIFSTSGSWQFAYLNKLSLCLSYVVSYCALV